jgi:hypothetical protein
LKAVGHFAFESFVQPLVFHLHCVLGCEDRDLFGVSDQIPIFAPYSINAHS